ncbi:hypothetical protein [Algibacter sp. 2305UL17-15]|uniref:hypothetical protein n=1 Tax=Algibacter sp. 2305UL17-15 TaxID=3231268 RepID=UPI00345836D3
MKNYYNVTPKQKDTIIIRPPILKFSTEDFKNSILKFKQIENHVVNSTKCANPIHSQFDFNKVSNFKGFESSIWDIKKISSLKAKLLPINEITFGDRYVSLSFPIFNENFDLALIKVDKSNAGEIIYFLKKKENIWKVDCELYISQY